MTAHLRLALAVLVALTPPALAQSPANPANIFGLPAEPASPGIETGTAVVDDSAAIAELVPLRESYARFRAAGFPLPDVADLDAYSPETLRAAARLIAGQEDPCTAAADLTMFLNAHVADTNLRAGWGNLNSRDKWIFRATAA